MIRYTLLRALDPDDDYPKSTFGLVLNNVRYDMPLLDSIGDSLAELLSPKGPFERIAHLSDRAGFHRFCVNPKQYETQPCYAESELRLETSQGGLLMGSLIQHAAASKLTAAEILRYAIDSKLCTDTPTDRLIENAFNNEVIEWLLQHGKFFQHCGGFELLRATYYFTSREDDPADVSVDSARPNLSPTHFAEKVDRLKIFREMLTAAT